MREPMKTRLSILFCSILITLGCLTYSCSFVFNTPVYKIARDPTWYPLNLRGREKNVLGFSDELMALIADRMNFQVKLQNSSWSNTIDGLHRGDYDAILTALMPTPHNKEVYSFSSSYFLTGPVLIVLDSSPIKTLDDLHSQKLSVQRGVSFSATIQRFPSLAIQTYNNTLDVMEELIANQTEGVVLEAIEAHSITQGLYRYQVRTILPPFTNEGLRVVSLANQDNELITKIEQGLKELKESGEYQELAQKWNVSLSKWTPLQSE